MSIYSLLNRSFTDTVVEFTKKQSKSLQVEDDMVKATLNSVEKIRGKLVQSFIDNGFNIDKIDYSHLTREIKDKLYVSWYNGFATGLDEADVNFSTGIDVAEFALIDELEESVRNLQSELNQAKTNRDRDSVQYYTSLLNREKAILAKEKINPINVKNTVIPVKKVLENDIEKTVNGTILNRKLNQINILKNKIKNPRMNQAERNKYQKEIKSLEDEFNIDSFQNLQNKTDYKTRNKKVTESLNLTLNTNRYASESSLSDGIDFLTQTDFGRVYLENRLDYISKLYKPVEKDLIRDRLTKVVSTEREMKGQPIIDINDSVIQKYFENGSITKDVNKSTLPVSNVRDLTSVNLPKSGAETQLYKAVKNAMYPDVTEVNSLAKKILNDNPNVDPINLTKDQALQFGFTSKVQFSRKILGEYSKLKNTDYFASKIGRVMATEVQAAHHLGRLTSYYNRKVDLVRWIPNARSKSGVCKRCELNSLKNGKGLSEFDFGFSGIYKLAETLVNPSLAIPRHPYCLCILRPLNGDETLAVTNAGYGTISQQAWLASMGGVASGTLQDYLNVDAGVPQDTKSWWSGVAKNVAIGAGVLATGFMMYYFMKSLTGKQIKQVVEKIVKDIPDLEPQLTKSMLIKDVVKSDIKGVPLPNLSSIEKTIEQIPIDARPVVNIPNNMEELLTEENVNVGSQGFKYFKESLDAHSQILNKSTVNNIELDTVKSQIQTAVEYLQDKSADPNVAKELKPFLKGAFEELGYISTNLESIQPVQLTDADLLRKYNSIRNSINFGDESKLDLALNKLRTLNAKTYGDNFNKRNYNNELTKGRKVAKQFKEVEQHFKNTIPEDELIPNPVDYVDNILNSIDDVDPIFKAKFDKYKQLQTEFDTLKNNLSDVRERNRYINKVDPFYPYSTTRLTKTGAIKVANDKVDQLVNVGKKINLNPDDFNFIDNDQLQSIVDKGVEILNSGKRNKKIVGYRVNYRDKKYVDDLVQDFISYKNGDAILSQQELEKIRKVVLYFTQLHIDDLRMAQFRLSNVLNDISKKQKRVFVVNFGK